MREAMRGIFIIVGLLLSGMVSVSIILDFMDKIFERTYKSKRIYRIIKYVFIVILAGINSLNNGWLNLIIVILAGEIIGIKFYSGNKKKILLYNVLLVIFMGTCESIGIVFVHFILQRLHITISSEILGSFFDLTINQIIVIAIYHLILIQILLKKNISELTHRQYFFSFLYALFSIINVYILFILVNDLSLEGELILVLITTVGIVIININFIKILEFASENNRLQYEKNLFLQQSKMQYQYYDYLEQQYRDSLSMLHDVKRHIWAIEELYRNKENETANEYSVDIGNIMNSFKMNEFTENRMLNIILNDKMRLADQSNIKFECTIDNINLNFIDNIDLTTIFANLLDNALEACAKRKGNKTIIVQVGAFNNLVVINIKNSIDEIHTGIGLNMKSSKKNHEGIGIPNVKKVVSKYNGDFNIQKEDSMFVCSIVISKQGRAM